MKEADNFDSDLFNDDDNSFQSNKSFTPQNLDNDTFKLRNDPQNLLFRYRLQLMNAYSNPVTTIDPATQEKSTTYKIKCKNHTTPKANKQGIEDIISYVEKFVNGHTVQGNIETIQEFRLKMTYISNDLTMHFMTMRIDWGIKINDIDSIISNAINLIDLFLTRTLNNEERRGYGEQFNESTERKIIPRDAPTVLQKVGSFLAGGKT